MGSKQKHSQEKTTVAPGPLKAAPPKSAVNPRDAEPAPSKIRDLARYFEDAKKELGKVSWPTRKEVKVTVIAVLILVCVMSFFLGIVDLILSKIMGAILSMGV
jgi:preprotein translocase subunit SecE